MKLLILSILVMISICGNAWAKEDCSKIDRYYIYGDGPKQQCRIANALEDIAEAIKSKGENQ